MDDAPAAAVVGTRWCGGGFFQIASSYYWAFKRLWTRCSDKALICILRCILSNKLHQSVHHLEHVMLYYFGNFFKAVFFYDFSNLDWLLLPIYLDLD